MNNDDFWDYGVPFLMIATIFLIVMGMVVVIFNTADDDYWDEAPHDCYIHTEIVRHWGAPEQKTVTELCPVDK